MDLTNADGVVVQDNVVSGNAASGIILFRGAGAVIRGNRVGTDAAGATAQPNGFAGINLLGTVGATIGGTGPGDRNVVAGVVGARRAAGSASSRTTWCAPPARSSPATASGRRRRASPALTPAGFDGIRVVNAVDTTDRRHRAGRRQPRRRLRELRDHDPARLDRDGDPGQHRRPAGRRVRRDPQRRRHRRGRRLPRHPHRREAGARNVVGGNRIGVYGAGPGTLIEGNLVGLAPDGRTVQGNEQGIALDGAAAGMRVGANVVSGNSVLGVVLKNTAGAVVAGNVIGRTADGAESRPNGFFGGVLLIDNSGGVVGGDTPGDANLIDGGVHPSIRAEGAGQLGTQLLGNLLRGTSHSLGIDLVPLAVTANDPGDADTGPNGLQNTPVVTKARRTAVAGTIATKPSTAARIQVFSASAVGRDTFALLGDATVTTDGAGAATFSIPVTANEGDSVVATATTSDGTSELSAPALVLVPRYGLKGARFRVVGRKLRVRIRNGTDADVRVRVKAKDTRKLKTVTKRIKARRTGRFQLKLPASTRRKLAATRRRKGKATYRPSVTVSNLTSGVKKTYKPKIKVK